MSAPLEGFLELRREPGSVPAPVLSSELTRRLDEAVRALACELDASRLALVATGGYAAGWMCLQSDVDLMVLHRGRIDAAEVRSVLHPLWDAGLRVGHAVRTPRQARTAARERLDTLTSLVATRLLWGSDDLYQSFRKAIAGAVRPGRTRIARSWLAEERERRIREPHHVMTSNLKTGRSGLRSLQLFAWFDATARLLGEDPPPPPTAATGVRDTLLEVRNALHAVTGRGHDQLDFELRVPVARHLGIEVPELLGRLLTARHTVERMVDDRWGADLEPGPGTRGLEPAAPSDPALAAATAALAAGRRFHPDEEAVIRAAGPPRWTAEDRSALVTLVQEPWGRRLWSRMAQLGWMRRALPEWHHTIALPHVVPFHVHPVADHLLRTVEALQATRADRSLADPDEDLLTLAALLHDVGKGRLGDHSSVGATLAEGVGMRIHLSHRDSADLATLVRHHLLLPDLAMRFDIDDPEVVDAAAEEIGSPRVLELLRHLTRADSMATGSDTWTPWKQALLDRAYEALRAAFSRAGPDDEARRQAVLAASPVPAEDAALHLDDLPPAYVRTIPPAVIALHLGLVHPVPGPGVVRVAGLDGDATTHLAVAAADRQGLVADIAGVLALRNISIIDARCFTRTDGVAVDVFEVVDSLRGGPVPPSRIAEVSADLKRVAAGSLALHEAVAAKRADYRAAVRRGVETRVAIRQQPGSWVIEITAPDRPGLLHDICRVLAEHALDIRRARIDTRGGEVVDAFYVAEAPEDSDGLRRDLAAAC